MSTNLANNFVTTPTATIASGATSFAVASAAGAPATPFDIAVSVPATNANWELMIVTNVTGTTFTVTRGAYGTTAVSHAATENVANVLTLAGVGALAITGDVTGNLGASVVAAINGSTVPAGGGLTTGNVLQVTGAGALGYAAVNLAGGAAFVTGALPSANQAAQTMGGAVGGTTAASTINLTGNASITGVLPSANQAAQTMGGDVTGTTAASVVAKITGSAGVVAIAATGNILTWAATTTAPGIAQTIAGVNITPAVMTIGAQSASVTSTTGTAVNTTGADLILLGSSGSTGNGGVWAPGNVYVSLQTPSTTGTGEAVFGVKRAGTLIAGLTTQIGQTTFGATYLGNNAPSSTNFALSSNNSLTTINGTGTVAAYIGNATPIFTATNHGIQFFGASTPAGGGINVIGITNATANPASNPSASVLLYSELTSSALKLRDPSGTTVTMGAASAGTVNTQAQQLLRFVQYGRVTTTGTTVTVSIPLATATTCCKLQVSGLIKVAVAGGGTTLGDTFLDTKIATFKNLAGTVSQVGSSVDLDASQSDASLSTSAITFTISTTNIVVTLTVNATTSTLGTADCTLVVEQIVN